MIISKNEVGRNVKKARETRSRVIGQKYTQKMLAKDAEISQGYLSDIENGRSYPSRDAGIAISNACGVSLDFILGTEKGFISDKLEVLKQLKQFVGDLLDLVYLPVIRNEKDEKDLLEKGNIDTYVLYPKKYDSDHHFLLQVTDDRFIDSGIDKDDMLVIRRQSTAMDGQIAVVMTKDTGFTLKKFDVHERDESIKDGFNIIGVAVSLTKNLI